MAAAHLDEIDATKVYPLPVFQRIAGMNDWAMRQARRAGLPVIRIGRRCYVRGSDFDKFLGQQAEQSIASSAN